MQRRINIHPRVSIPYYFIIILRVKPNQFSSKPLDLFVLIIMFTEGRSRFEHAWRVQYIPKLNVLWPTWNRMSTWNTPRYLHLATSGIRYCCYSQYGGGAADVQQDDLVLGFMGAETCPITGTLCLFGLLDDEQNIETQKYDVGEPR
jgi:hypothetical protein